MHDCENCNRDERTPETIPYIVYEGAMDRAERHTKKWIIAFFVALSMLFATNIGWIIYESQFETYYYAQDGAEINNVNIGEQGDVLNGAETEDKEETQESNLQSKRRKGCCKEDEGETMTTLYDYKFSRA